MKLIQQTAELFVQKPGLQGVYEQIERAGRTCYKSEDKIQYDENGNSLTAKGFVDRMIKSNHLAMLEQGTVYLKDESWSGSTLKKYTYNKYSRCTDVHLESETIEDGNDVYTDHKWGYYVTTNLRVIIENGWEEDLQFICEPTEYHEKRTTIKVNTSIGVTRELNRHRTFSIAEQSTRYCNYSKDKFGKEITFCIPEWYDKGGFVNPDGTVKMPVDYTTFINALTYAESSYMYSIGQGLQPQQAREVLPLCTATEAVYTAFESDWKHFFDLRYFEKTGKVHPNMKDLAIKMYNLWQQY